jgi:hypothetical protein
VLIVSARVLVSLDAEVQYSFVSRGGMVGERVGSWLHFCSELFHLV